VYFLSVFLLACLLTVSCVCFVLQFVIPDIVTINEYTVVTFWHKLKRAVDVHSKGEDVSTFLDGWARWIGLLKASYVCQSHTLSHYDDIFNGSLRRVIQR